MTHRRTLAAPLAVATVAAALAAAVAPTATAAIAHTGGPRPAQASAM